MAEMYKTATSELFIVDNSDTDWKVLQYLREWCQLSQRVDVATGYFEIGALLALGNEWQKVDQIRILMGDEVSQRTKRAFEAGLQAATARLDASLEAEKEQNDFLTGVPAIVDGIKSGKINCRVYHRDKFHAKAYITHARQAVVGSFALVGSSNLTYPGLTENVELNVRFGGTEAEVLQQWYEDHWNQAENVTPDILQTIERHVIEYPPFEVYAKALQKLLEGEELTDHEWEQNHSIMFPLLGKYQQDAYGALLKKARTYDGAFLCDGVGLGKTYVGLALIERLVERDRRRVALFVPKAAREPVWEAALSKYLSHLSDGYGTLKVFNHTDLLRKGPIARQIEQVKEQADVIVIDEAHHFRNTGTKGDDPNDPQSRYWAMHNLCGPREDGQPKQVFMLTATPVNNRLTDLQHMIELFSRQQPDHFRRLGIHSLTGHFRRMENALRQRSNATQNGDETDPPDTDMVEAEQILADDTLFQEVVVQRSRAYVRKSMETAEGDGNVTFPDRRPPQVAHYELKKVYGRLLDMVEQAFHNKEPLFALSIYYPWRHYKGDVEQVDKWLTGREGQIVRLIRTGFLKRFESSAAAFEASCWALLQKLLAWAEVHSETRGQKDRLEKWKLRHKDLLGYESNKQYELYAQAQEDEPDEDVVPPELLENVEKRSPDEFNIPEILADTYNDLDQIVEFLTELRKFKPRNDSKLQALIKLLRKDKVMSQHKVLIFTEFMTTARYLEQQLKEAGIDGVFEIDSQRASSDRRGETIRRFAPYYNGSSSAELREAGENEIRILISTDVLSEGLNLQDATRMINYDLHWNPVRLMQRIGRVDRRMNPEVEAMIIEDHPEQEEIRGKIEFWNFLPPDELNRLLSLYNTVTHKTLRISKTFGIEGKKLLTPDDDFDALRIFDETYEGQTTPVEAMRLELQNILKDNPGLEQKLDLLPGRVFSGKTHLKADTRAVFFCYALPAHDETATSDAGEETWTLQAGPVRWYLYNLVAEESAKENANASPVIDDPAAIHEVIRCAPDEARRCNIAQKTLSDVRKKVEKQIKNTYLKQVQAPLGAPKPKLIAWMELN